MTQLFSLQGRVLIGDRLPNGKPGAMWWAGNVPSAQLELSTESTTKKESFSGNRLSYGKLNTAKGAKFTGTFDEWFSNNLALGLYSTPIAVAAGAVTGEEFPDDLVVGDLVRLDHPFASDLLITDSTGTPVTVPTTDYRFDPTGHSDSVVEVLALTGTQPWKAAYSYGAAERIEMFTDPAKDRYVLFDGINTENGDPVVIDMYRANFDPFTNLGLIQEEYGSLAFSADMLFDSLNLDENGKGGYVRITRKALT